MGFSVRTLAVLATAAALLSGPAALFAHGVEVSDQGDSGGALRAARFMYSTGEPMMYARVKVFPPSRPDAEALSSITDRNGNFAFLPDEAGDWRLEVEDGMGHKGTITVAVAGEDGAAPVAGGAGSGGKLPLPLAIALGLSAILNVFALMSFAATRRGKGGTVAH